MYKYTQAHRLRKADEFSSVFLFQRKVYSCVYFKMYFKPTGLANSRLGIIVSKKVHKRANRRNYMKRVIRELFRHSYCNWNSYDIIVRVQRIFTNEDYNSLREDFSRLTKLFLK